MNMNENKDFSTKKSIESISMERKHEIAYKLFHYMWTGIDSSKTKKEIKEWISVKGIDAVASMLEIPEKDLELFLKETALDGWK